MGEVLSSAMLLIEVGYPSTHFLVPSSSPFPQLDHTSTLCTLVPQLQIRLLGNRCCLHNPQLIHLRLILSP